MVKDENHTSIAELQLLSKTDFEVLFCRFHPQIVAYTAAIIDNQTVAEDIAQEVFVYVWENRMKLHFGDGFRSYLFQSAYSRCVDYIKKNKQLEKYARQSLLKFAEEYESYIENDCHSIKELFSKDFDEKLNALLGELPEARRNVFNLIYRDGLKAKEVSDQLQMPQRTVESHLYLTLKYLRENISSTDFLILMLFCKFF